MVTRRGFFGMLAGAAAAAFAPKPLVGLALPPPQYRLTQEYNKKFIKFLYANSNRFIEESKVAEARAALSHFSSDMPMPTERMDVVFETPFQKDLTEAMEYAAPGSDEWRLYDTSRSNLGPRYRIRRARPEAA